MSETPNTPLQQVPLHEAHVALGAKMVPFAGYEMPVQYATGMLREHIHTRTAAGLFDVSHMGQVVLLPRKGRVAEVAAALETLVPADIVSLAPGRQRYALFTKAAGGILDDLMVASFYDYDQSYLFQVVNASRKEADFEHLRQGLAGVADVVVQRKALLALQGPKAEAALAALAPAAAAMKFMDAAELRILDAPCLVSRSGYTGEDGFEISIDEAHAQALWAELLKNPVVAPVGLAARDSLRLEAGLCLYGSDIDETTTPVEAALEWSIGKQRRPGGARAGGFPGAEVIFEQLARGTARRRVGLLPDRRPARAGVALYETEKSQEVIGRVSSGGFGATLDGPVSMGYVETRFAAVGGEVYTDINGRRYATRVATMPFVAHGYKR